MGCVAYLLLMGNQVANKKDFVEKQVIKHVIHDHAFVGHKSLDHILMHI